MYLLKEVDMIHSDGDILHLLKPDYTGFYTLPSQFFASLLIFNYVQMKICLIEFNFAALCDRLIIRLYTVPIFLAKLDFPMRTRKIRRVIAFSSSNVYIQLKL